MCHYLLVFLASVNSKRETKERKLQRKREKENKAGEKERTYKSIHLLSSSGIYLIVLELVSGRISISDWMYIPSLVG